MAVSSKFVTPDELSEIRFACRELDDLSRRLSGFTSIDVNILQEADGTGRTFPVTDSNGDVIGHIGYGDSGYALFLDDGNE